jgi:hypothetical protein
VNDHHDVDILRKRIERTFRVDEITAAEERP